MTSISSFSRAERLVKACERGHWNVVRAEAIALKEEWFDYMDVMDAFYDVCEKGIVRGVEAFLPGVPTLESPTYLEAALEGRHVQVALLLLDHTALSAMNPSESDEELITQIARCGHVGLLKKALNELPLGVEEGVHALAATTNCPSLTLPLWSLLINNGERDQVVAQIHATHDWSAADAVGVVLPSPDRADWLAQFPPGTLSQTCSLLRRGDLEQQGSSNHRPRFRG